LLVGFVVSSWSAAKPRPVVIVNPQSSAVRAEPGARKHHPRAVTKRMPEKPTASNPLSPCLPVPVASNERTSSLVTPAPTQDQKHDTFEPQDRKYQGRPRVSMPVAPHPGTNQVLAVAWAASASPFAANVPTKIVPVLRTDVSVSLATQRRSEPGFRRFQMQVESGKQPFEPGFSPFRH
jgi:hypothetical protein